MCDINKKPYAVWMGSMNATLNGSNSEECGTYTVNDSVAAAYYQNYLEVRAKSEVKTF